jgi:hypothetical protein
MTSAKLAGSALCACLATVSCTTTTGGTVEATEIPIACRLDGLTADDRAREGVLLEEHLASFVEVREDEAGYSYRYASDPARFARMAELVALEHRCCPFLTFSLEWPGADADPWLRIGGGARVKPFVAGTFGDTPAPR